MSQPARKSKTGAIIGVVLVLIVIVVAFVPIIPRSYTAVGTQVQIVPTSTVIVSTQVVPTQVVMTQTQTATTTQQIYNLQSYTLNGGQCIDVGSVSLNTGQVVSATWNAQNTVDGFLLSSSQYASYSCSSSATALASQTNVAQATIGFVATSSDTYYFVIYNPHDGLFGLGATSVGIYSATGTATSPQVVYSYSTSSYNTAILSTTTSYYNTNETTTVTTSTSCVQNLISDLSNSHC